jgi:hypothetical protein
MWLEKSQKFGKLFAKVYSKEDVTPYLHVFVYHVGYYVEHYGSMEMYANYAIESHHKSNKDAIKHNTNGFSNNDDPNKSVQMQQLRLSVRKTRARFQRTPKKASRRGRPKKAKTNWTTTILAEPDFDLDSPFLTS